MLSKESSKYFKRVLALSGVMSKAWSMCSRETQKERMNKLLAKLKCPKNATPAETKKFLKSLSMEELFKFYPEGMSGKANFLYIFTVFLAVVIKLMRRRVFNTSK